MPNLACDSVFTLRQDNEILNSSYAQESVKPIKKKAKVVSEDVKRDAMSYSQTLQKRQRKYMDIQSGEKDFENRESASHESSRSKRFRRIKIGPKRTIKRPLSSKESAQTSKPNFILVPFRCPAYSKQSNEPV